MLLLRLSFLSRSTNRASASKQQKPVMPCTQKETFIHWISGLGSAGLPCHNRAWNCVRGRVNSKTVWCFDILNKDISQHPTFKMQKRSSPRRIVLRMWERQMKHVWSYSTSVRCSRQYLPLQILCRDTLKEHTIIIWFGDNPRILKHQNGVKKEKYHQCRITKIIIVTTR